jgi:hypothetical protein
MFLAEREGFEPSIRENRILDFESSAFDHSATFPFWSFAARCAAKQESIAETFVERNNNFLGATMSLRQRLRISSNN